MDCHAREDQTKMYTIQWDSYRRKNKNICGDDTRPKSDSELSSELQSESTMSRAFGGSSCTELWTESRVAIGVLLNRSMGLKVAKHFERGIFIGQVTNVYASGIENDGEIFFRIEYEDGDSEHVNGNELRKGVSLYHLTRKPQNNTSKSLNQSMGFKVAKHFETGVFTGQVTNIYAYTENIIYHIEYEDGDTEDFDENEFQQGLALYCCIQKRHKRKRKNSKKKEGQLIEDADRPLRKNDTRHSFGALFDKATPIHTLILGTFPAKKSLSVNRYFSNTNNAFWWIAGDCLGFRRSIGEKCSGGRMKLCAHLRYDESHTISYEKQTSTLCQHGFALWDIIASCERKGSLDRAIKHDKPNDIKGFVEQNPTIKTIVFANGKSCLAIFKRHFSDWFKSGKLIMHEAEEASVTNVTDTITCVCALSVSPAASTLTYKEKRDFWEKFVYLPGLKLQQKPATSIVQERAQQNHRHD